MPPAQAQQGDGPELNGESCEHDGNDSSLQDTLLSTARGSLTPFPTAESVSYACLKSCVNVTELARDLARATMCVSRPLCGLREVRSALALALIDALGTYSERECSQSEEPRTSSVEEKAVSSWADPVYAVLRSATVCSSQLNLVEAVYEELACLAVARQSRRAAFCAADLCATFMSHTEALCRGRALICDALIVLGTCDACSCLGVISAMGEAFNAAGLRVFSPGCKSGRSDFDVLEETVLRVILALAPASADKGKLCDESEGVFFDCSFISAVRSEYTGVFRGGSIEASVSSGHQCPNMLERLLSEDDTPADLLSANHVALALHSITLPVDVVYHDVLANHLWPALCDSALAKDDLGQVRVRDEKSSVRLFCRAALGVGMIVSTLGPSSQHHAQVGRAVDHVIRSLSSLLEADCLPEESRLCVARALLKILDGGIVRSALRQEPALQGIYTSAAGSISQWSRLYRRDVSSLSDNEQRLLRNTARLTRNETGEFT